MFSLDQITKSGLYDDGKIFDKAFDHLQGHHPPYNIIQIYSPNNIKNIFDSFLNCHSGSVFTLESNLCKYVKYNNLKKEETTYKDFDPMRILRGISGCINLFYINTFDKEWNESHPQALFNMHLLASSAHLFIRGSMILLDDCFEKNISSSSKWWRPMGKSFYMSMWLDRIGGIPIYKELNQQLWIIP